MKIQGTILENLSLPAESELLVSLFRTTNPDIPARLLTNNDGWKFEPLPHDWRRAFSWFDVTAGSLSQPYVPLTDPERAIPREYSPRAFGLSGPKFLEKGQPVVLTYTRDPGVKGADAKWICYRKWKPGFTDSCWENSWEGLKRVPLPRDNQQTVEIPLPVDHFAAEGIYWFTLENESSGRPKPYPVQSLAVGPAGFSSQPTRVYQLIRDEHNEKKFVPALVPTPFFSPGHPIATVPKVTKLVAGCRSFFALTSEGVFAWGENERAQLGLGDTKERHTPTHVLIEKQSMTCTLRISITGEAALTTW